METPAVEEFLDLCAELTGFDVPELRETGMADTYYATVLRQVGKEHYGRLVRASGRRGADQPAPDDEVLREIAGALTHLWYLGMWPELSAPVQAALGRPSANISFTVSPQAYVEGLVWRTFQGHPPSAKTPGGRT